MKVNSSNKFKYKNRTHSKLFRNDNRKGHVNRPKSRTISIDFAKYNGLLKKALELLKKRKIVIVSVLLIIAILGIVVISSNITARKLEKYTEITFITPTQALVFWRSNDETLGYVKYGESRFGRKRIEKQTSSEKSTIHVVILEAVPVTGTYIQKYNESYPFWIFPQTVFIKYDGSNNADE